MSCTSTITYLGFQADGEELGFRVDGKELGEFGIVALKNCSVKTDCSVGDGCQHMPDGPDDLTVHDDGTITWWERDGVHDIQVLAEPRSGKFSYNGPVFQNSGFEKGQATFETELGWKTERTCFDKRTAEEVNMDEPLDRLEKGGSRAEATRDEEHEDEVQK